jgi:hypothetical protein
MERPVMQLLMLRRALLGLLLRGGTPVVGLMFQSTAVSSQWDTWAFAENGTYYAYYLITEHSPGESPPRGNKSFVHHPVKFH